MFSFRASGWPSGRPSGRASRRASRLLAAAVALLPVHLFSAAAPTFYKDILPVLQDHCQRCHRPGEVAPMPLLTYAQTRPWAASIKQQVKTKAMPPWFAAPGPIHFADDPSLSPEQIQTIAAWTDGGAPEGNRNDAPPPKKWAGEWNIDKPTAIVRMPTPVNLPASGDVDYTYEIVRTGFTADTWVHMAEVRPSARDHVHHAVVYIRPPGSAWLKHAPVGQAFTAEDLKDEHDRRDAMWTDSDVLLVYAPGSSPDRWGPDRAKLIPKGSDLVFQMHYTTHDRAAHDQTSIGLVASTTAPKQRVLTLQLTNDRFTIPPGVDDYRVESHGTMPNDATLLSFFPHLHLRGKRFQYNLVKADGASEPLLDVNYNFFWQLSYRLETPIELKAGTELQAVAWFDNSKNNPHNPDPESAVTWGDQTYDEMMVGFFDVAVPVGTDKWKFFDRTQGHDGSASH